MTIEYGDFKNYKNWVATFCTSGGVMYSPLGPDGQPVWLGATMTRPDFDGVVIDESQDIKDWLARGGNSIMASFQLQS